MAYIDVSGLPGVTLLAGIDPVTRDMFLSANTVNAEINPIDIYKEMRICRRLNEDLRPFDVFLSGRGNNPKGPGKATERFVIQNQGTRFVPFDLTHQLTVTGTVITDDGQEGIACFDRTPLSATSNVDINYVPPQVEVITVQAGSGLDATQDELLREIHAGTIRYVHVDRDNVAFGDGTPSNPFNTFDAAVAWGNLKSIRRMYVRSDCELDADVEDFEVYGASQARINLNGFSVDSTDFHNCEIHGSSTGFGTYRECNILNGTSGMGGFYYNCAISGDVSALPGGYLIIAECFSGIPGDGRPSVDLLGAATQFGLRKWGGGIEARGISDGSAVTIELDNGEVRLSANCDSQSNLNIRGVGFFENLGTASPNTRSLINPAEAQAANAKVDQLTFTKANELDVNVQSLNGTDLLGSGDNGDKWRG